jgi:hypothetical protein
MATRPAHADPEQVTRLLGHYADATETDTITGATWYADAFEHAERIADQCGASVQSVAGAIAALSPLREWDRNVADAEQVASTFSTGGEVPMLHFGQNLDRACKCLSGNNPDDVLGGPKVRAFYAAIMGDWSSVTIDRWAVQAAKGQAARTGTPSAAQYRDLQAAYTEAARSVGLEPAVFQAIVWVTVRRTTQEQDDARM